MAPSKTPMIASGHRSPSSVMRQLARRNEFRFAVEAAGRPLPNEVVALDLDLDDARTDGTAQPRRYRGQDAAGVVVLQRLEELDDVGASRIATRFDQSLHEHLRARP